MKRIRLFTVIAIFSITACTGQGSPLTGVTQANPTAETGTKAVQVETIVASTMAAFATSPQPAITPTPGNEWVLHSVDLFGFTLSLPTDWQIQEFNRRAEPNDKIGPVIGHDCADYKINSPDLAAVLFIRPICGYAEGFPGQYPALTVIINTGVKGNLPGEFDENHTGRFLYEGSYVYTHCYLYRYEDLAGTHTENVCISPPALWIKDLIPMTIQLNYSGDGGHKDQVFAIADRIVLSIAKK